MSMTPPSRFASSGAADGARVPFNPRLQSGVVAPPESLLDVSGRQKVSLHQNIFDADFEYGLQPLRWETLAVNGGTAVALSASGGIALTATTAANSTVIRQSRPYHRYQPGKSLYMATAIQFGTQAPNSFQRVGLFDDGNGAFFEQDGTGQIFCVIRSDVNGLPVDTRIPQSQWNRATGLPATVDPNSNLVLDFTAIQMLWLEYAWYGAGTIRFGVLINGVPIILHQISRGNTTGAISPWSRTGNLPARYEIRHIGVTLLQTIMHWGVSVILEGRSDDQRGFTYTYGTAPGVRRTVPLNSTRFPLLSFRMRTMGTILEANSATSGTTTTLTRTGAGWTVNAFIGRFVLVTTASGPRMGRIQSNTADTLTITDSVLGAPLDAAVTAGAYQIGYPSRGQLLPRQLIISATSLATVELIVNPTTLTGANFASLVSLGSPNSFAERDVSATALVGGEVVFAFTAPAGGSGLLQLELENLFPLFSNIRGTATDIMTLAVSTPGTASDVAAHIICQEAMS
jgi:hypothetical protein